MFTFLEFNFIDATFPDTNAWGGGEPPLDGLAINTDGSKMDEGVFCPNPVCSSLMNQEASLNGKITLQ